MATARQQPKPKTTLNNPFGEFKYWKYGSFSFSYLGIAINGRQRPTLIQATRAATAFTTGLALPGGYTYVCLLEIHWNYSDFLKDLSWSISCFKWFNSIPHCDSTTSWCSIYNSIFTTWPCYNWTTDGNLYVWVW